MQVAEPKLDIRPLGANHGLRPWVTKSLSTVSNNRPDVAFWPIASFRCDAAICPELEVNRKSLSCARNDAFDPERSSSCLSFSLTTRFEAWERESPPPTQTIAAMSCSQPGDLSMSSRMSPPGPSLPSKVSALMSAIGCKADVPRTIGAVPDQ